MTKFQPTSDFNEVLERYEKTISLLQDTELSKIHNDYHLRDAEQMRIDFLEERIFYENILTEIKINTEVQKKYTQEDIDKTFIIMDKITEIINLITVLIRKYKTERNDPEKDIQELNENSQNIDEAFVEYEKIIFDPVKSVIKNELEYQDMKLHRDGFVNNLKVFREAKNRIPKEKTEINHAKIKYYNKVIAWLRKCICRIDECIENYCQENRRKVEEINETITKDDWRNVDPSIFNLGEN